MPISNMYRKKSGETILQQ